MENPRKKPEKGPEKESSQLPGLNLPKIKIPGSIKPDIFNRFSPRLQVQLSELMQFEQVISEKLKDPQEQELFIHKPNEFFAKHQIKTSPFIQRKLREFDVQTVLPSEEFIMPNGERLVPHVKIHIKQ